MVLAANIIGIVAVIESLAIFAVQKRDHILLFKLLANILWLTNYSLLGLWSGAILNGIAIVREIIFFLRPRYRWADNRAWAFVFMALMLGSSVLTFESTGWLGIVPAIGSQFNILSLYSKRTLTMRLLTLPAETLWLVYAAVSGNITAILNEVFLLVSALVGLAIQYATYRRARREKAAEDDCENAKCD